MLAAWRTISLQTTGLRAATRVATCSVAAPSPPGRWRSARSASRRPRASRASSRGRPCGGRRQTRPNILVVVVDEMRAPRWFPAPSTLDLLLPNIASIRRGGVVVRGPFHRLQRLHAGARLPRHRALRTADRLPDHRPQRARARVPDLGNAAARAGLPDELVGQVAPVERLDARAVGVLRRQLPVAERRPVPGHPRRSRDRVAVRGLVPRRRRRRPVVHDGLVRQPARHRLVAPLDRARAGRALGAAIFLRAARQLRDAGAARRARQAAAADGAPGDSTAVAFGDGPVHGARGAPALVRAARPLPEAAARRRRAGRPRPARAPQPSRRRARHDRAVHLRPWRVRRVARSARQGRGGVRRGDPDPALRQGPARRADGARRIVRAAS